MVSMPSSSDAAEKFARRGSAASQDYQQGVTNSSDSDWQSGAQNAAGNWEEGVQEAIANGAFASGVSNPNASWQQRSLELGASRFGPGITASQGKYESAVQPYFDGLEALTLTPRGPRGSSQNFQRSQEVGQRLLEIRRSR